MQRQQPEQITNLDRIANRLHQALEISWINITSQKSYVQKIIAKAPWIFWLVNLPQAFFFPYWFKNQCSKTRTQMFLWIKVKIKLRNRNSLRFFPVRFKNQCSKTRTQRFLWIKVKIKPRNRNSLRFFPVRSFPPFARLQNTVLTFPSYLNLRQIIRYQTLMKRGSLLRTIKCNYLHTRQKMINKLLPQLARETKRQKKSQSWKTLKYYRSSFRQLKQIITWCTL